MSGSDLQHALLRFCFENFGFLSHHSVDFRNLNWLTKVMANFGCFKKLKSYFFFGNYFQWSTFLKKSVDCPFYLKTKVIAYLYMLLTSIGLLKSLKESHQAFLFTFCPKGGLLWCWNDLWSALVRGNLAVQWSPQLSLFII